MGMQVFENIAYFNCPQNCLFFPDWILILTQDRFEVLAINEFLDQVGTFIVRKEIVDLG